MLIWGGAEDSCGLSCWAGFGVLMEGVVFAPEFKGEDGIL